MRVPPDYWDRYQETEGLPGDIAAGPDPAQAMIQQYRLMNPGVSDEEVVQAVMRGLIKGLPPTQPEQPMSPQDYIDMQFEQLQKPRGR